MLGGDIFGPETNLWIGPRASIRNFTCMPPTSTTRMWRALALPRIFLLARIGLDYARAAAQRAMLALRFGGSNERLACNDSVRCCACCCDCPHRVRGVLRAARCRDLDLEGHGLHRHWRGSGHGRSLARN